MRSLPVRRTRRLRQIAAAATLGLTLTAVSACGDDDGSAEDTASEASSEESAGADSEPAEEDAAPGDTVAKDDFVEMFGDAFEQASTATITLKSGGQMSVEGTGAIDFDRDPIAMQMSMEIPQAPTPLEFILVDAKIYQQTGQADGKYISFDLEDPNSPFGSDFADQLDPRASFENFEKGLQAVTYEGEQDGLDTYALSVDSAALLEGTEAEGQSGTLPETIEYTMSFDDEGYFRLFTTDLGEAGGQFEASYDNWGEPVDITAPKASQITQLPGQ